MADVSEVPIIEVHSENFKDIYPSLVLAIQSSTFIAIDTELSGLGDRKQLMAKGIEERYKAISEVAKTRSLISLGLSCFKLSPTSDTSNGGQNSSCNVDSASPSDIESTLTVNCDSVLKGNFDSSLPSLKNRTLENAVLNRSSVDGAAGFTVQTFNILIMCSESYVVEPASIKFLLEHGFDFNRQFSMGLPYSRGNDKSDESSHHSLRQIFTHIILSRVPLVLHNALVDLVFLYESFYAALPRSMATFLADCSQIFSAGVWDTKYIAEFVLRMQASYLEYSFRKSLRDNSSSACAGHEYANIKFLSYDEAMTQHIIFSPCGLTTRPCSRDIGKEIICKSYANHGWCATGAKCRKSHDVDMILDAEEWVISGKTKKRTRVRRNHGLSQTASDSDDDIRDVSDNEMSDDLADGLQANQLESNMALRISCSTNAGQLKNDVTSIDSNKIVEIEQKNNVMPQESLRMRVNQSEYCIDSCENGMRSISPCHIDVNQLNFAETAKSVAEAHVISSIAACNGLSANKVLDSDQFSNGNNLSEIERSNQCINSSNDLTSKASVVSSNPNCISSNGDDCQQNRAVGHRAGFDAFMTGYIFAAYVVKYTTQNADNLSCRKPAEDKGSNKKSRNQEVPVSNTQIDCETQRSVGTTPANEMKNSSGNRFVLPEEFSNKIYLSGKDFPLHIIQSNFTKFSKDHTDKWTRIWRDRDDS